MGNEQLTKAKDTALFRANFDYNNLKEETSDMSSYAHDGTPCVYVSGESDRLGYITQVNMSLCRVFGFSKKDQLVNH